MFAKPKRPPADPLAQEIYYAPPPRLRYILVGMVSASQVIFWGNLGQWAATGYTVKDEYNWLLYLTHTRDTGDIVLADPLSRYTYGGWLFGMGLIFASVILFVPSRYYNFENWLMWRMISRVVYHPGKRALQVETPTMFRPFTRVSVIYAQLARYKVGAKMKTGRGNTIMNKI
jgi:TMEM70/TMEM186/TMEM223 protein family